MKLFEYEGKSIFKDMDIPIPNGGPVRNIEELKSVVNKIGFPVVVKSQVLSGGRGKQGGIKFAENEEQLFKVADELFSTELSGERVEVLLIEEKIAIARELYLGITFNLEESLPLMIISLKGGMDIEYVAENFPEEIFKIHLDPLNIPKTHELTEIFLKAGLKRRELLKVTSIAVKLINCFFENNAITCEINPLVIDKQGRVLAVDSKIEIDDSAVFRIKRISQFIRKEKKIDPYELEAKEAGVVYVRLEEGDIGLISGGAGLGMASMDMIINYGGKPANFLDLGGATEEKTANALKIVLKTPGVKGVLINVFGGVNNCEKMAKGIAKALDEVQPTQKIVVKMRGFSQEEGWTLLEKMDIPIIKYGTTEDAVKLLIEKMKKGSKGL